MMCGRLAYREDEQALLSLVKQYYKEKKLDELVFRGRMDKIVRKSLTTFQRIAFQCLHDEREQRPTASEVVLQLKKALEFQVSNFH
ncbi:hypothetical protein HanHA300_Chr11g0420181 [Helianthus annuus]|nr:hypothetical protein HanHA300_Chr11g0420181 [Helianthus annuus]KAJ0519047.1 hypothetical protein HanHA89_Chr11g0444231 [Helianthus annuus]KAJ0687043.1 hypothetical protein HanLR1_Chr11g0421481 [Helianthus annuus]